VNKVYSEQTSQILGVWLIIKEKFSSSSASAKTYKILALFSEFKDLREPW